MNNLDVRHYLAIYTLRKEMQEKNITSPSEQIKSFTRNFVEKLRALPLDEEVIFRKSSFFDKNGNLILKIPD